MMTVPKILNNYIVKNLLIFIMLFALSALLIFGVNIYFTESRQRNLEISDFKKVNTKFSSQLPNTIDDNFSFLNFLVNTSYSSVALEFNMYQQFYDLIKTSKISEQAVVGFVFLKPDGKLISHNLYDSKIIDAFEDRLKKIPPEILDRNSVLLDGYVFYIRSILRGGSVVGYLGAIQKSDDFIRALRLKYHEKTLHYRTIEPSIALISADDSFRIEYKHQLTNTFTDIIYSPSSILILLICVVLMALFSIVLRQSLAKPIKSILALIKSISINQLPSEKLIPSDPMFEQIANALLHMHSERGRLETIERQHEVAKKTISVSAQVAHDIRSPLAALKVMGEFLQEVPEEKRLLIRSAVQRIEDIANDLAGKKQQENTVQTSTGKKSVYLLSSIIDALISEKRLQFRSRINVNIRAELDHQSYGLFAKLELHQFKRVLSNLINNAVEAFENGGDIVVTVQNAGDNIIITVTDNGIGIPADILPKLTQHGVTFGKTHGKGLGLNHAKETIESLGGRLIIESITGQGTKVLISLPRHEAPEWFVAELKIPDVVIILDDDSSIHQIWENRLVDAGFNKARIFHFTTTAAITEWCTQNNRDGCLFLMDYEILGENQTGLDVIAELKISNQAIMVTSRYEEDNVLLRCEALRVKLLPKNLAGFVPIVIQSKSELSAPIEYVLIDDQEMNHSTWQTIGRIKKKNVATFFNPESFFSAAPKLDKQVKIYVDSDLGHGIKGEDISKQIADIGFSEIYICTGYRSGDFEPMPWVKGVVGKKPPFA